MKTKAFGCVRGTGRDRAERLWPSGCFGSHRQEKPVFSGAHGYWSVPRRLTAHLFGWRLRYLYATTPARRLHGDPAIYPSELQYRTTFWEEENAVNVNLFWWFSTVSLRFLCGWWWFLRKLAPVCLAVYRATDVLCQNIIGCVINDVNNKQNAVVFASFLIFIRIYLTTWVSTTESWVIFSTQVLFFEGLFYQSWVVFG